MFTSWQTYERLQISVYSLIEATKFLLTEGFEFVLTERVCQDVLEEYFGRQRSLGRRNNNPTLKEFGYNDNTLRIQHSCATVMGNTRKRDPSKRKKSWYFVDNTKHKKRK